MNKQRINAVVKQLKAFHHTINSVPRDSKPFNKASTRFDGLVFSNVSVQDLGLIVKGLGHQLTNEELAELIVAGQDGKSVMGVFPLPASILMAHKLRECRQNLGMSQSKFSKRFGVPQPKLSRMEAGAQKIDVDFLQRVLHELHDTFLIA